MSRDRSLRIPLTQEEYDDLQAGAGGTPLAVWARSELLRLAGKTVSEPAPKGRQRDEALRTRVLELHEQGLKPRQIAETTGCSIGWARKVIRGE